MYYSFRLVRPLGRVEGPRAVRKVLQSPLQWATEIVPNSPWASLRIPASKNIVLG
jgi:hypothetical protein